METPKACFILNLPFESSCLISLHIVDVRRKDEEVTAQELEEMTERERAHQESQLNPIHLTGFQFEIQTIAKLELL